MNLQNQTVTGIDQVTVQDSLNAALLELLINLRANSVAPNTTDLIIYVDNQPKTNPSSERKEYLFELSDILRTYSGVSDEFSQKLEVVNNDIVLKSIITRNISYDETTQTSSVLQTPEIEELESYPVILFDGVNYIYTNYSNTDIELIYVKDTAENKVLLNGSMYYDYKIKNEGGCSGRDLYFKNAFTKTGDDLNLEVNNLSLDSFQSNNNMFSLDENGNLVVNTITCNSINGTGSNISMEDIFDSIYPVGSIYLSVNSVSPSVLFGGTWERIENKFLLGADDTNHIAGSIGGNETHTHGLNDYAYAKVGTWGGTGGGIAIAHAVTHVTLPHVNQKWNFGQPVANGSQFGSTVAGLGGTTDEESSLPPYLSIYIWKRVQ